MRERELALKFRVGLFVSALVLLFAAFVLAIGTQRRLFEERYTLTAAFRDIQGLIVGSPVRLAGLTIGTVSHISFSSDPADPRIHVEVSIDRRFQPRIREDSVATIGTIGLVGDKIFEITAGSEQARILAPGERLKSVEPVEVAGMIAKGGEAIETVAEASRSLTENLQTLKGILEAVEKKQGLLHALVYDEAGGKVIQDLAPLVQTLNRNATRLEEILKAIHEKEGLLHALVFDEGGEVLLQDLRSLASDLKAISGDLAEGRGTFGALLQDPTIYEDLSSLLRGAERSWILRGLIRSSVRSGRDAPTEGGK